MHVFLILFVEPSLPLSVTAQSAHGLFVCVCVCFLYVPQVEEGGKASLLQHPLLVGDEVVIINEVELSGWRQEAISLVKGSYKTLRLTVRR
ncbi:hypothetical protein PO909_007711 [Leuciscus waleckii]